MNELEEALRSALRDRAEAADREVSLIGPVAYRVRRARRRCALTASALTAIVGAGLTVTVHASSVLQSAAGRPWGTQSHMAVKAGVGSPATGHASGTRHASASTYGPVTVAAPANSRLGLPLAPARLAGGAFSLFPASARLVVLTQAPRVSVPAGWRWYLFGGIRFATPASWVVERKGWWVSCPYGVAPMTVLMRSSALRAAYGCGRLSWPDTPRLAVTSTPGVIVGAGRYSLDEIAPDAMVSPCLRLAGMRACVLQPAYADLVLKVAVFPPGAAGPTLVEIGQGTSDATAQAILDSIRPAR